MIRTRFFDDWLVGAIRQGIRQVVLVAAGLDTRAYRLAWPDGTAVYELDLPEVFVFKDSVLAEVGAVSASERRVVPVDLRGGWTTPLLNAGLDRTLRSAWLIEGLIIYLSANEAARVLLSVGDLSA